MNELLKKLRRYEIRIRKAVNSRLQGDFHSIFKGSGLEFDDVRPYQYGDEVRAIDWNISTKGHGVFVKTFHEEREQAIFFILDVSASQQIGQAGHTKLDVAKEICGVLALSGANRSAQIGLIAFSDRREVQVKPGKGMRQAYKVIYALDRLKPRSTKTDLNQALRFAVSFIKRKSVVVLLSDFIDVGYSESLGALACKHDLILIQVTDRHETRFPRLGMVQVQDRETQKMIWANTSFGSFPRDMEERARARRAELEALRKKHKVTFLDLSVEEDYVPRLLELFRIRNRSLRVV